MHVCFLAIDYHESYAGGGIASYVAALAKSLQEHKHRITIIAKGRNFQVTKDKDIHIIHVPLGNIHWYFYRAGFPSIFYLPIRELEWSWALTKAVDQLLQRDTIDLIEGCETGLIFIRSRLTRWPPVIIRLHGEQYTFNKYSNQPNKLGERLCRRLELSALRRASAVTSPSRFHAMEWASSLDWPNQKIAVIPNPIDPWLLQQALSIDDETRHTQRHKVILYTGRIEYRKGTITLLKAVPHTVGLDPAARFVVAGGRHPSIDNATLQNLMREPKISRHTQLVGHVPWKELIDWYQRAAVFVMPSYYETFGISVVEAMAFGLPVVATTAGGLPEVVENGLTGLLVPPGDSLALAEAIACLLSDPSLRRRMGQAGREKVLQMYTVEKIFTETITTYERTLSCRRGWCR